MRFPECEPDALFKCNNGRLHGTHRRDALPTYKGHLDCYRCRKEGIRANLEFVGLELTICKHCPEPSFVNIEGENLCKHHADEWSRGEGRAALEYEIDNEEPK